MVVHLIPFSSLSPETSVDVRSIDELHEGFVALASSRHENRFNFDGRIIAPFPNEGEASLHAYLQIFRSGILEAVSASLIHGPSLGRGKIVYSMHLEQTLIDYTLRYLRLIDSLELDFPAAVMLSLTGVKGFRIHPDQRQRWNHDPYPIDHDILLLPRVVFESSDDDVPTVLRPAFDAIWNAAGWAGSMNYTESGEYRRE